VSKVRKYRRENNERRRVGEESETRVEVIKKGRKGRESVLKSLQSRVEESEERGSLYVDLGAGLFPGERDEGVQKF